MAGGSGKLQKVAEELGAAEEDSGIGGGQPEGIQDVIQGSSAGGIYFRVGDVGADPLHWTGPVKLSAQGCPADHKKTAEATIGRGLGISTAGGSNGLVRF